MLFRSIVLVAPTVPADGEDIGFLKGDIKQKLDPYCEASLYNLEKLINAVERPGAKIVEEMVKRGMIEIRCVTFMRGANIDNAIYLIEEAQNLTKEAMKTLITRLGENSVLILSGDKTQTDHTDIRRGKKKCGLVYAMEKLNGLEEVGVEIGRAHV